MTGDEVKIILLALLAPSRNRLVDIPADVNGWRHPTGITDASSQAVNENDEHYYHQSVCSWTGVTCDPIDGSVIGLNLGNGFYTKTLLGLSDDDDDDDVVGEDRNSRALLPRDNDSMMLNKSRCREKRSISGIMPTSSTYPSFPSSLGKLRSLRFINMSSNRLQGMVPKSVLQLPNLEILDISANDLEGTFPHVESNALRVLDISNNRFQGPLDEHLFGHPVTGPHTAPYLLSLVKFDISHNGFNGTIPLDGTSAYYDAVTKGDALQNLLYFDLGSNLFTGTISNNVGNFHSLQGLFLEHNRLVGTIPKSLFGSNPLPLVQLFLQQNSLSGTLNEDIAKLPNLRELYVDGNKLTGTIPRSFCSTKLNIAFVNNTHHPTACDDISCPANSASREGVHPCTSCPDDGGFHRYIGQHDSICRGKMSEIEILDLFFDSLKGDEWLNSSYFWSKGVAACGREGVECNANGQVTKIVLSSLGLRGPIIPQLGSLSELQVLNLSNNQLTGFLPSDLRFPPLKKLDVRGSRLQGVVPPLLCIKEGVNGNGGFESQYACENIVCPRGTYSQIGRATLPENDGDEGIQCLPCYDDHARLYMGSDHCTDVVIAGLQIRRSKFRHGLIISVPVVCAIVTVIVLTVKRHHQRPLSASSMDDCSHGEDEKDDEDDSVNFALGARLSSLSIEADDDWTAADSEGEDSRPFNRTQPLPGRKVRINYF